MNQYIITEEQMKAIFDMSGIFCPASDYNKMQKLRKDIRSRPYNPQAERERRSGMTKNAKIERNQKLFIAAMKKKFSEDPTIPLTKTEKELKHISLFPEHRKDGE